MNRIQKTWADISATITLSAFGPGDKRKELHAIIEVDDCGELFSLQYNRLKQAEQRLLEMPNATGLQVVFKRYFLSDAINQRPLMGDDTSCSVSYIQQPPLLRGKVAVWIYMMECDDIEHDGDMYIVRNNGYEHLWQMGMTATKGDSYNQAWQILADYDADLRLHGATIQDNCIRTWFFTRDVDMQYKGLVEARREFFGNIGLTEDTHYIASTGIGGGAPDRRVIHQLGTYAVKGLQKDQIIYLQAADNMNRTSDYGVTFERGTKVIYDDRSHIFISGTASINNRGEVVHIGDIRRQTLRMWENVEALLHEAQSCWDDVMQIIVYLRDICDRDTVEKLFHEKFPNLPYLITLAPVCRPEWLIEMECIAVSE